MSIPIGRAIDRLLAAYLEERRAEAGAIDARLGELVAELAAVVGSGGKRLRPELALWGWRAAGGDPGDPRIVRAGAALELLHTFALVQDDVADRSDTRRGRPASHIGLAAMARHGDAAHLGGSLAILVADLALIWADRLVHEAGFEPDRLGPGLRIYDALRAEVTLGQCLDLVAAHDDVPDEEAALRVNRLKTAGYTVLRPIQLGIALAGGDPRLIDLVPGFAVPAGIAFQLRDDLLGALGEAELTGKPSGDDIVEGKRTWLLARTLRLSAPDPRARLEAILAADARGAAEVGVVRAAMRDTGAVDQAEALIGEMGAEALAAAAALPVEAGLRAELAAITRRLLWRAS